MRACALVAAAIALASTPAGATVIRVDVAGTGDHLTISEGVAAAGEGDTVLVLPGTYTGTANRTIDFLGVNMVLRSLSGAAATIIDCEGLDRAFHFFGGEDSTSVVEGFTITNGFGNSGGAITIDSASPTILNCVFDGNTATTGGAVDCDGCGAVLIGCTFSGNSSTGGGGSGGALIVGGSGTPVVRDCLFTENAAQGDGGAIAAFFSSPTIRDSEFGGNTTVSAGGAVSLHRCPAVTLTNDTIWKNEAASDGGGIYCSMGSLTVDSCAVAGNAASAAGGGIMSYQATLVMRSSSLSGNAAVAGGGGVRCMGGSATITATEFITNSVDQATSDGGGASLLDLTVAALDRCTFTGNLGRFGGGIFAENCATSVNRCTVGPLNDAQNGGGMHLRSCPGVVDSTDFTGNTAVNGAGLTIRASAPTVNACTFSQNSAQSSGGGLYVYLSSSPVVTSCLFERNTAVDYGPGVQLTASSGSFTNCTFARNGDGGAFHLTGSAAYPTISRCIFAFSQAGQAVACITGEPEITHCYVFGNAGGDSLCGNYHDNAFLHPRFCDTAASDYTLCANSPCLPGGNVWGELIGARAKGCADCDSPVGAATWGRIKSLYRAE